MSGSDLGPTSAFGTDSRVALVTGAGSGIGAAIAHALSTAGYSVIAADIDHAAALAIARTISESGRPALGLQVDVASATCVAGMFEAALATFGTLDVAVNNAGVSSATRGFEETSEEEFDRLIAVNLKGVWLCMKHEIALFRARKAGTIVNVASALGLIGAATTPVYSATKHGVVGLTRSAALEHARNGIRVNAICPGIIETPLIRKAAVNEALFQSILDRHPVGRLGTPQEVADAVVWLASPAASFITGTTLAVDGGWTAG